MKNFRVFLFDLGGVLEAWDVDPLYTDLIPDAAQRTDFIVNTLHQWIFDSDRSTWREQCTLRCAQHPEYRRLLELYGTDFERTLKGPITGTVDILKQVKALGFKAYAASNWPADLFERSQPHMPFLPLFDGMQISGQVGIIKPDPAFFQRMMKDFAFTADEAIFIDDRDVNIAAAQALGIASIHFQSPAQLKVDIEKLIGPLEATSYPPTAQIQARTCRP